MLQEMSHDALQKKENDTSKLFRASERNEEY